MFGVLNGMTPSDYLRDLKGRGYTYVCCGCQEVLRKIPLDGAGKQRHDCGCKRFMPIENAITNLIESGEKSIFEKK